MTSNSHNCISSYFVINMSKFGACRVSHYCIGWNKGHCRGLLVWHKKLGHPSESKGRKAKYWRETCQHCLAKDRTSHLLSQQTESSGNEGLPIVVWIITKVIPRSGLNRGCFLFPNYHAFFDIFWIMQTKLVYFYHPSVIPKYVSVQVDFLFTINLLDLCFHYLITGAVR